jgi:S1-C subfamily serine protease
MNQNKTFLPYSYIKSRTQENIRYIGIMGTDITPEIADVLGFEETKGFLVTKVVEGCPSQIGGLKGSEGIFLTASG